MIPGSSTGLSAANGTIFVAPSGNVQSGNSFGISIAVADYTGNGRMDFTIGANFDAGWNGAGAMYFYTGRQQTTVPQFWSRYDQHSGAFQ